MAKHKTRRDVAHRKAPCWPAALALLTLLAACSDRRDATSARLKAPDASSEVKPPTEILRSDVILAPAPHWLTPAHLGVPVGADFNPVEGYASLVPRRYRAPVAALNRVSVGFRELTTDAELKAHVKAWGREFAIGGESHTRILLLENVLVRQRLAFSPDWQLEAPPKGARYVVTGIHVGHLLQTRFRSGSRALTADVAAKIRNVGVGVAGQWGEGTIKMELYAAGVGDDDPKAALRTYETPEAFEKSFSAPSTRAVPILVEYAPVKEGGAPKHGSLAWAQEDAFFYRIEPGELRVVDDGSNFTTTWWLRVHCLRDNTPIWLRELRTADDENPADPSQVKPKPKPVQTFDLMRSVVDKGAIRDLRPRWVEVPANNKQSVECEIQLHILPTFLNATWQYKWTERILLPKSPTKSTSMVVKGKGSFRCELPIIVKKVEAKL